MAQLVKDILKENDITVADCKAIAVSKGPGSYMGLRIATSLAKGIAYGGNLRFIGVSTLDVIGQNAIDSNLLQNGESKIVTMIDAGRMEVYAATFDTSLNEITPVCAKILNFDSYAEYLEREKVLFTGNGALKFQNYLQEEAKNNPLIDKRLRNATFKEQLPHASGLRIKAFQKIQKEEYDSVAYFEPFYLKDFIPGKPKKLL